MEINMEQERNAEASNRIPSFEQMYRAPQAQIYLLVGNCVF